ncbi:MAG: hypothetical protein VB858_09445 [Planctomycetaceae bacterium]
MIPAGQASPERGGGQVSVKRKNRSVAEEITNQVLDHTLEENRF